jgi:Fic family protein
MKPYVPEKLPLDKLDYKRLISKVGEANASIARYDGLLQAVVNPEILLSPLTTREAVLSSKIEGTQATFDEVLQHEAGMLVRDENKEKDIQEISNYRSTLILAEKELKEKPITLFLIRQMHGELMTSVRGENKDPGKFREIQNWIGKPGSPIGEATYIPPEPPMMSEHLQNFESYIQGDDLDVLIQSAIVHAQFELIHPFLDGNGRIGRLLIPLFLFYKKRLKRPMFYLSEYLESNREAYYTKLHSISTDGKWDEWIGFYLKAVKEQGRRNAKRVENILQLYEEVRIKIRDLTRSEYTNDIVNSLFDKPLFRSSDIQKRTIIPKQTLMPILKKLIEGKIIVPIREAKGSRPAVLKFPKLLEITEN